MNTHMAASGGQVTDGAAGGRRAPATAGHHRVLIVDDESAIRFGIRAFLEARGYEVDEAATCGAAEAAFRESRPDVVVLDHMLTDGTALDLPRSRSSC
jgi:DNA-binding NtrC family response regulator